MENIDEDIKDLNKYISFSKKSENFSHNTDYEWHKELGEKIENLLSRLKTAERMNELMADELKEITGSCPLDIFDYDLDCENKCEQEIDGKCWAEYFRNKAKEE